MHSLDRNNTNIEAKIAEYNATSERLNYISGAQDTLFVFACTATGAILTLSIQQYNPYIALISFIILIAIRCRVMWFRNVYLRELIYIKVFLAPELGLDTNAKDIIKPDAGISSVHFHIYTLLGVGAFLVYLLNNPQRVIFLFITISMLLIVIGLDCYYHLSAKPLTKKYTNKLKHEKKKEC